MPRAPAIFGPGPLGGRGSPLEDEARSQLDLYGQLGLTGSPVRRPASAAPGWRNKQTRQVDTGTERKVAVPYAPQQMMPFYQALQEMPEYQDYWSGLQAAGVDADMAGGPPSQVDLSPVMAFADYAAPGGTALRGYSKPAKYGERLKSTLDAQQKLQDDRRDMLKTIVSAMALARSGGFQTDTTKVRETNEKTAQSQGFGGSGGSTNFDPLKFREGFEKSKTVEPFQTRLTNGIRLLEEFRGDPNWFKSRNAQALIVEFRGLKPVSDRDYKAGGGGDELLNKVNALFGKYIEGKGDFTAQDISDIQRHVRAMVHDANKHMEKLAEQFASGVIANDTRAQKAGISPQQAAQVLRPYPTGFLPPESGDLMKSQMDRIMEAVEKKSAPKAPASPTPSLKDQVDKAKQGLAVPDIKKVLEEFKKPKRTDQ